MPATRKTAGWTTHISPGAVLVSVAYGVWPARRASILDPNVALRYAKAGATASAP